MTTIRVEWMITGDPGPGFERPYRFVWGPDYVRMRALSPEQVEADARATFAQLTAPMVDGPRPGGPALMDARLRFRVVVETDWEEA